MYKVLIYLAIFEKARIHNLYTRKVLSFWRSEYSYFARIICLKTMSNTLCTLVRGSQSKKSLNVREININRIRYSKSKNDPKFSK